jgi:hypothetical protein
MNSGDLIPATKNLKSIALSLGLLFFLLRSAFAADFYVAPAPAGASTNNGTIDSPWDLQTAFAHPSAVKQGDTIWLRGGVYAGIFHSRLIGTESAPITVASHPGEWARIDSPAGTGGDTFLVTGQWTVYRDVELFSSDATQVRNRTYLAPNSPHNKFVNMIIHDVGNNSFGRGNEIYGSIFFNNGTDGSGLSHDLYTQNNNPAVPARIVDCIIFNGYAFGIHAYATNGFLRGIDMIGNILFQSGVAQTNGDRKDNIIVASVNTHPEKIVLRENMTWAPSAGARSVSFGRYQNDNYDISLFDNYLIGTTRFSNQWRSVTMTGNTFYSLAIDVDSNVKSGDHPQNTHLTTRPTQNKIFIRPNAYEAGRAHIAVYNWEGADHVDVSLSGVVEAGDKIEIRNAQNYFAAPVFSGTYSGGSISLPMTGLAPAQPLGPGKIDPAEMTGKNFNVFVVRKTDGAIAPPTDTQKPTVPGNLTASAVSSSQINLTWSASSDNVGVMGYKVFRNGQNAAIATLGNVTSFSNTGLVAGVTYSYQVSAIDAAGNESAKSAPVGAQTVPLIENENPNAPNSVFGFLPFKNIFNPAKGETLRIRYVLDGRDLQGMSLSIRDRRGNTVIILGGHLQQVDGVYETVWDGRGESRSVVAAGTYIVVLKKNGTVVTKKIVAVK